MFKKSAQFYALKKDLHLSHEKLQRLRNKRVKKIVNHAYCHVPYYKNLFDDNNISPNEINTVDDLKRIPISTKEDLLEAGIDNLIADNVNKDSLIYKATSGSSGKPFQVCLSKKDAMVRKFMEPRVMLEHGLTMMERRVTLGPPTVKDKKQFFNYTIEKYLPIEEVVRQLKARNPKVLYVHPQLLNTVLNYTNGRIDEVCKPKVIYTLREKMDDILLCRLKEQIDFEHFNFYGSSEFGVVAWECKSHRGLHVNDDQVVLEILPLDDSCQVNDAAVGEVIITTLNNMAMPFIRYRQGDLAKSVSGQCDCGCNFSMISSIQGRSSDLIYLPSGRTVPAYFCAHKIKDIPELFDNIRQFLTVQESKDKIVIKLVPVNKIDNNHIELLKTRLLESLGEKIEIDVQCVDKIDTEGLKLKDFVSLVN